MSSRRGNITLAAAAWAAFGLGYWSGASRDLGAPGSGDPDASSDSVPDAAGAGGRGLPADGGTGARTRRGPGGLALRTPAEMEPPAARPLSPRGVEAFAAEALTDASQLQRSIAFARLLESLTAENAPAVMAALHEYQAGGDQWHLFRYAWGRVDPEGAMEQAVSIEGSSRRVVITSTLSGWGSVDPVGAAHWVDAMEEGEEQQRFREFAVASLANHDIRLATDYVLGLAAAGDEMARQHLDTVASKLMDGGEMAAAAAWSESLPEGELKGRAMKRVANRFTAEDPRAAAAWADRLTGVDHGTIVVEEVAEGWAKRDPAAAVAWLRTLPPGTAQAEGMRAAFNKWAWRDPNAAGELLNAMADLPARDAALSGFAYNVVRSDPEAAIAWANAIGQEELRVDTLTRTARAWHRRDHEAAEAWLPTSGLPPETQAEIVGRPARRR